MEFYRGKRNPNWIYRIVNEKVFSINLVTRSITVNLNAATPRANKDGYAVVREDEFNRLLMLYDFREHIVTSSIKSKMIRAF